MDHDRTHEKEQIAKSAKWHKQINDDKHRNPNAQHYYRTQYIHNQAKLPTLSDRQESS